MFLLFYSKLDCPLEVILVVLSANNYLSVVKSFL